jgi:hypothetical protein
VGVLLFSSFALNRHPPARDWKNKEEKPVLAFLYQRQCNAEIKSNDTMKSQVSAMACATRIIHGEWKKQS